MPSDQLQKEVQALLRTQGGIELVVGLVGFFEAVEDLQCLLHGRSVPRFVGWWSFG